MLYTPGISSAHSYNDNWDTDILDALGIGTQRRAQEYNSAEAELQRQWETNMSNTAYQRAVQDMQKAGLNPALMFGTANAASTPSGASGNINGSAGALINSLTNLIHAKNTSKMISLNHKNHNIIRQVLTKLK